jgi:hypothetical protein
MPPDAGGRRYGIVTARTCRSYARAMYSDEQAAALYEVLDPDGAVLRVDRASLRFLDADALARFLAGAGFELEAQYGGWSREPLGPASPEIITVAR